MKNTHRFYYPHSNVTQDKILVSHEEWLKIKAMPYDKNDKEDKAYKQAIKQLTGGLDWFTDRSPLYKAISTGVLELPNYSFKCEVIELK